FAVEIRGAWEDFLFVFEDGLDHFGGGGRRGVVGAAGLEILHEFCAAISSALDNLCEAIGGDEFGDRNSGDSGITRQRDHGVAVAAEDESGHVFYADF